MRPVFVRRAAWSLALFLLVAAPPARAQNGRDRHLAERMVLTASRAAGSITLDGRLDEESWSRAAVARDFVQQRPSTGAPATQRTEARVLFDGDAMYVGMRMYDSAPDSIVARLGRRDYDGFTDWAQVIVDSYHDRQTAFRFAVNPSGVKKDVFHFDDVREDPGWDAVWDAATAIDAEGWTAELRIPLSQLRYSGSTGDPTWGINFLRDLARRNERSYWKEMPTDVTGFVSQLGELDGIGRLPSPRRLEVVPYSLGRLTREPGELADPFYERNALFGTVGADVKYGVTSNLTLTAAINPDFGQVEADPSQVNLSAFESFFAEKRPFFLEGADIFRVETSFPFGIKGINFTQNAMFYSRRVGRAPQRDLPSGTQYDDTPDATTILAAAKLTGKTRSGWSIGVLDALTSEERSRLVTADGLRVEQPVEPLTNYAIFRAIKDFRNGESAVGGIFTATNRRLDDDSLDFLRRSAYTFGIDARHRWRNGMYSLRGAVVGSYVQGEDSAIARTQRSSTHYFQRPDAAHLDYDPSRGALAGVLADLRLQKISGNWRWALFNQAISPGYEANDIGFQRSTDWLLTGGWLGFRSFTPGRIFRNYSIFTNPRAGMTFGGERVSTATDLNLWGEFLNYWTAWGGWYVDLPALGTNTLRGGPAIKHDLTYSHWLGVSSDVRKRVSFELWGDRWREPSTGGGGFGAGSVIRMRPSTSAELSLEPTMFRNGDTWQYVTTATGDDGPHYVFARIRQTTTFLTMRGSYTFTPNLSLQLYAQPFLSAGRYREFKEVADPRAEKFTDRLRTFVAAELLHDPDNDSYSVLDAGGQTRFSFEDPDFNVRELRSNAILRWEYRPGSTLYVVWGQGRAEEGSDGRFRLRREARRLFSTDATNVLLVKLSYWMSL